MKIKIRANVRPRGPPIAPSLISVRGTYSIGMFRAACRKFALGFVCLSAHAAASADSVVLKGKEPFLNVTVTDVRNGRLHFRGVSGETLQKPVGVVAHVTLGAFPELTVAEDALAAGDFDSALAALTECEKAIRTPWHRLLVKYRRLAVLSAAGHTDQALATFLELLREEPQTPVENLPADIGPTGSAGNRTALALLRKARLRGISPALEQALAIRRLELTLCEEPDAVRREFSPLEERGVPQAAGSQPSEDEDAPLLFGTPRAGPIAAPIALTRSSPLRNEADRLRHAGDALAALKLLERARPFVRVPDRGWWTLDAARCRIELREYARAADELLAVAAAADAPKAAQTGGSAAPADRALASWSLYYVGLAHEGLSRPDVAVDQYRELRNRDDLPANLRLEVETALERLKSRN